MDSEHPGPAELAVQASNLHRDEVGQRTPSGLRRCALGNSACRRCRIVAAPGIHHRGDYHPEDPTESCERGLVSVTRHELRIAQSQRCRDAGKMDSSLVSTDRSNPPYGAPPYLPVLDSRLIPRNPAAIVLRHLNEVSTERC